MYRGEKIDLVAMEPEHVVTGNAWMNDPDITHYLSTYLPMPKKASMKWYDSVLNDPCSHVFAIVTKKGLHIGTVGLHGIDWKNRHGELGIVIGEDRFHGRGYGADSVRTILKFAFLEMNLNRVFLKVWAYNKKAISCYEKCAFRREGILRDALYHDGKFHDALLMGVLRRDFERLEKNNG